MNRKKILLLIIICTITLLVLFIILMNLQLRKNEELKNDLIINEQLQQKSLSEYSEGKIFPRKLSTLYGKYKGKNSKNELYQSIYNLVNYLPKLYDDIKGIDDIKKYYDDNFIEIKRYLGITEFEEFDKFIEKIKLIEFKNISFNSCEIDDATYVQIGDYLTFNLLMVYDGLEENMILKIYFSNNSLSNPKIKYKFID